MAVALGFRFVAFLFVSLLCFSADGSQGMNDEAEFEYIEGLKGPSNWGNLKEEWKNCLRGKRQSPIDIRDDAVSRPALEPLQLSYKASNAMLANRGHDIQVAWPSGGGTIVIGRTNFTLSQMHWHSPSEHTINGKRYALEAHVVHRSLDGKIAVIAVLYKNGRSDPFLRSLEKSLRGLIEMETVIKNNETMKTEIGEINAMDVVCGRREYYRYIGSLTSPPCTEEVVWTILQKESTVTKKQVKLLQQAVHVGFENNARPTQQTNGRNITMFTTQS